MSSLFKCLLAVLMGVLWVTAAAGQDAKPFLYVPAAKPPAQTLREPETKQGNDTSSEAATPRSPTVTEGQPATPELRSTARDETQPMAGHETKDGRDGPWPKSR